MRRHPYLTCRNREPDAHPPGRRLRKILADLTTARNKAKVIAKSDPSQMIACHPAKSFYPLGTWLPLQ
jgi:hypothetical protein